MVVSPSALGSTQRPGPHMQPRQDLTPSQRARGTGANVAGQLAKAGLVRDREEFEQIAERIARFIETGKWEPR